MGDDNRSGTIAQIADDPAPANRARLQWLRDPVLWRVAALTLAHHVALELFGAVSAFRAGNRDPWLSMWPWWDAHHYLRLAEVGYASRTGDDPLYIVFFPFYPLAVQFLSYLVRDLVLSALLVSFGASIAAGLLLHKLVRLDAGEDEAWRAVLLLITFPTAYYFAAPYTEALFLAAVLGAVYAARTMRWPAAGLSAAIATGTRVAGLALLPALAVEAAFRRGSTRRRLVSLFWAGTGVAGFAFYLGINQVVKGDPLAFLEVQRSHWFQHAVPPWVPLADAVSAIHRGGLKPDEKIIFGGRLLGAAFAVLVLIAGRKHLRVADTVYAWGGLVLVLSASWLLSLPRYLLGLYPLFLIEARFTRRRAVLVPALVAGSLLQLWLMWRYARGWWTF